MGNAWLDQQTVPPTSGSVLTLSPESASQASIPGSWQLTAYSTPVISGSLFQALGEVFTSEVEYLRPALANTFLTLSRTYDLSEVEYVWVVDHDRPVHKVEVKLSDGSWSTVLPALGQHDAFQTTGWKWLGSENSALLIGLDVFECPASGRVDSWQFLAVDPDNTGFQSSVVYYEHPWSKNWMPMHPTLYRVEDGFLGLWSARSSRTRLRIPSKARDLPTLQVRLNGDTTAIATLAQPWTSLDERGLWTAMERHERETNSTYGERLFMLSRVQGQTQRNLTGVLGAQLGTATRSTFTTSSSSLVLGASNAGRYQVHNYQQYVYVVEKMLPDVSSTTMWKSRYASPSLGCLYLNGTKVDHTLVSVSGSLVSVDKTVDNRLDVLEAHWRLQLWADTASGIVLTNNFPLNVEELTVVKAAQVQVDGSPSQASLRRSFLRTSPIYRWASTVRNGEQSSGMATFG